MRQLVLLAALGCSSPARPSTIGNAPDGASATFAARLEDEIGTGQPVAIVPGATLRALSADGSRERVLAPGPVSWALVDQRGGVVWFGNVDRTTLFALDLEARTSTPQIVKVVTGLPESTSAGAIAMTIAYGSGPETDELSFGHPITPHAILRLGETPSLDAAGGILEMWDQQAELLATVQSAKIVARDFLVDIARRHPDRRTRNLFASKEHRVPGIDPAQCEGDGKLCGRAETLFGTKLWRVTVGFTCGDGCYMEQHLYDPDTAQFLVGEWAKQLQDAWIAPDGSAFVVDARIYRFSGGPVASTPATAASGGGWLGKSYYVGL